MIGVILWRDVAEGKAVVWCEDQGDLAFFNELRDTMDPDVLLDVGDVVRFDVHAQSNLRVATNVSRLLENWGNLLNDALRQIPEEPSGVREGTGAKIVPLRTAQPETAGQSIRDTLRRHG